MADGIKIAIGIFFTVLGFFIIASGQVFEAVRETALNTRKAADVKRDTQYNVLLILCKLNNLLGWIVILAGWIVPFAD